MNSGQLAPRQLKVRSSYSSKHDFVAVLYFLPLSVASISHDVNDDLLFSAQTFHGVPQILRIGRRVEVWSVDDRSLLLSIGKL